MAAAARPADSLFGLVTTVFRKARRLRLAVLHILSGVTGRLRHLTDRAVARALHLPPPATDYLYFVARGDGSSEFSRTLEEHNRAVAQYIRKRNP